MTDDADGTGPEPIRRVLRRALCEPLEPTTARFVAQELDFAEDKLPAALELFRVVVGAEHASFVLDRIMKASDGPWAWIPGRGFVALEPTGTTGRAYRVRTAEWDAIQQIDRLMRRRQERAS